MIERAERSNLLKPKGTIVEATAGNTGIALAIMALKKGYKMIIVVPDKMTIEKGLSSKGVRSKSNNYKI